MQEMVFILRFNRDYVLDILGCFNIHISFCTGCFLRADLFGTKITEILNKQQGDGSKHFNPPYKHFVFGRLVRNFDGKALIWDYHVAPIIKIKCPGGCTGKDGDLYVLDPVISSEPMLKDDFHAELESEGGSKLIGYVTCQTNTFTEESNCFDPDLDSDLMAVDIYTEFFLKQ